MTTAAQPITREPEPVVSGLDLARIRADFPILAERINGKPLVYLDNAATSQKPRVVLDAIANYYEHMNANIHRGVHTLSVRATEAHDAARADRQEASSTQPTRARLFLCAAPPRLSISSRRLTAVSTSARATKSSSRPWSTIRTLCPGRFFAKKKARTSKPCAHRRSRRTAARQIRQKPHRPAYQDRCRHLKPSSKRAGHGSSAARDDRSWRTAKRRSRAGRWKRKAVPHFAVDVQALRRRLLCSSAATSSLR